MATTTRIRPRQQAQRRRIINIMSRRRDQSPTPEPAPISTPPILSRDMLIGGIGDSTGISNSNSRDGAATPDLQALTGLFTLQTLVRLADSMQTPQQLPGRDDRRMTPAEVMQELGQRGFQVVGEQPYRGGDIYKQGRYLRTIKRIGVVAITGILLGAAAYFIPPANQLVHDNVPGASTLFKGNTDESKTDSPESIKATLESKLPMAFRPFAESKLTSNKEAVGDTLGIPVTISITKNGKTYTITGDAAQLTVSQPSIIFYAKIANDLPNNDKDKSSLVSVTADSKKPGSYTVALNNKGLSYHVFLQSNGVPVDDSSFAWMIYNTDAKNQNLLTVLKKKYPNLNDKDVEQLVKNLNDAQAPIANALMQSIVEQVVEDEKFMKALEEQLNLLVASRVYDGLNLNGSQINVESNEVSPEAITDDTSKIYTVRGLPAGFRLDQQPDFRTSTPAKPSQGTKE